MGRKEGTDMAKYNGHRSWNAWNVALWIGNDEGLYNCAIDCIRRRRTLRGAAVLFMQFVSGEKTPDGAVYNLTCVREALAGLRD
jgi:hypothetical protein